MPELLELSGLSDDGFGCTDVCDCCPSLGAEPPAVPWLGLLVTGGLAALLAWVAFRSRGAGSLMSGLGELGIIARCRKEDQNSKKPSRMQVWCLWDSKKTRILGRHPTRQRALRQERLIQMRKHGIPTRR